MTQPVSFEEIKQKKERGVGCRGILEAELKDVENADSNLVVTLSKNGKVSVSYSRNSSLEVIGMLQVGIDIILDEMKS